MERLPRQGTRMRGLSSAQIRLIPRLTQPVRASSRLTQTQQEERVSQLIRDLRRSGHARVPVVKDEAALEPPGVITPPEEQREMRRMHEECDHLARSAQLRAEETREMLERRAHQTNFPALARCAVLSSVVPRNQQKSHPPPRKKMPPTMEPATISSKVLLLRPHSQLAP